MTTRWRIAAIAGCVVLLTAVQVWRRHDRLSDPTPSKSYSGSSEGLEATVFVPTLDTPMPPGKNVIWCSSFQIAWNKLRNDVIKAPVEVKGAEAIAKRLNNAPQSENDLAPDSYFAAAGFVKDGITDQIAKGMAKEFAAAPTPQFDAPPEALVAYAYLAANVDFTIPFFENRKDLVFKDSNGKETRVSSFGVRPEDDYAYFGLRKQVGLLFVRMAAEGFRKLEEFAVDPCNGSSPYQLVLACVKPEGTLGETVAALDKKAAEAAGTRDRETLGPNDVLLVPNAFWEITHRFRELEGKERLLLNQGFEHYYVDTALQTTRFRLDRSGAELSSEAKMFLRPFPSYYVFNRPFLIIMRKRGAAQPFFVMWVDNAELLEKR
ncbi:MAG: hypothetical protein NTW87_23075 [Planctomycetota bacterium]|nr:hypothetical protein [Planctomycetota bacterium]